jgi:hypothetical protein
MKQKFLTIVMIFALVLASFFASAPFRVQGDTPTPTLPKVAVHVSQYTEAHWPYTTWKYFQMYSILEEALRSDGTPFVEITDSEIEGGGLLTSSGLPKYPILFSLAAECISSGEAQKIKDYVQAGGFVYVGSSSWTRKSDGTAYMTPPPPLGVSAVADSTWGPAYVASNTLDSDPNTQWFMQNDKYSSSTGLPITVPINITYTFDDPQEINKIELTQTHWTGNNYKTKNFDIWVSADGTAWNRVAQGQLPNTDSVAQNTTFSAVTAKKVKISVTSVWVSQAANTGGLADFKAFTTSGGRIPPPTIPPKYTFWLSQEMGLECLPTYYETTVPGGRWNSWSNIGPSGKGVLVETTTGHRLVDHIPKGRRLLWIAPSSYDVCPSSDTQTHFAWATKSIGATVLGTFEWTGSVDKTSAGYYNIPLIAYNNYGSGCFIYHSELGIPLAYGTWGPDAFTYTIVRKAVEWAFEANNAPLVRLAPWQYPTKAAFIIRTDCDGGISDMLNYVAIDEARGAHGEYYIVTNEAAGSVPDPASILNQAKNRGAITGSHSSYHTGPDSEAYATAFQNIKGSLDQLQTWVGFRPQIWVSPTYTAIKEQSFQIIRDNGLLTSGEQGVGLYPHFALSMETKTKHYNILELPTLEYFSDRMTNYESILHCFSFYTNNCNDANGTMRQAIDFAYSLEGLINIYSHFRPGNLQRRAYYIEYTKTKPDVWFTSSQDIYNWWLRRNTTSITPTYERGSPDRINVAVSGPSDSGPFALDIKIPWAHETVVVKVNGAVITNYENVGGKLRVPCGSPSQVEILLPHAGIESYHLSGIQDDEFVPGEPICVRGSGFNPGNYPTYVVKDVSWSEPMDIPARIAESSVTADSSGNIAKTTIWSSATPGKYDIIVDVNGNSQYDAGIDVLDDLDIGNAGFFVIPEYAIGTILALAVCFTGVAVYKWSKRTKQKAV